MPRLQLHLKKKGAFKVTEKTGGGAGPVGAAFLQSLSSLTRRFNQASLPQLYQPPPAAAPGGAWAVCRWVVGGWRACTLVLT